ncbi:tetratricopeptide repeat protein [Beijerinckia mobilis]|uniref:tetratricopeptide repeat protein n=1 Tax=Beijerinckia mobilis TaxID=231434 RepID=UPI00068AE683|nr:tetratricopeptide repeat protein [Beijerinckia mobilis]
MRLDRTKRRHAIILAASLISACLMPFAAPLFPAHAEMASAAAAAANGAEEIGTGGIGVLSTDAPAGFAGSSACATCHPAETRAWLTSQHAHAMSLAGPKTVLGDFNDKRIEHKGSSARFFRDGERFMVETIGADGKTAIFAISDTFGIDPLQQYLVTFPDGRRQALPFAYDTRPAKDGGQRWFFLYPNETITASDPLHWTGALQNWNFMCAECHSTALRKNYDAATDRFETHFSEISVGCEACHGPARGHIDWAKGPRDPQIAHKGFASVAAVRPKPDWTVDPATGSPAHGTTRPAGDEVETCARCHSRRGILSENWHPGQALTDTHLPSLLSEGLFEADGQMKDEVFNDQAFKQSLMYARGVVCSDCHEPHSAQLRAPGSAVCGQCHDPARFATTHHSGHSPGANAPDCIACHMPKRTYMVIDERHDHSFRIPRPDLSMQLGTPNACNDCHRDKPASWAADAVTRWHGHEREGVRKGFQTWATAFAAARHGAPEAREALIRLAKTPSVPAIARATAVSELQAFPSIATEAAIRAALADPDPLVRISAIQGQEGQPLATRWQRLSPLLADPVLAVRIEAASQLAEQPMDGLTEAERSRLEAAFRDYESAQRLNADRAEGRANLGMFMLKRGNPAGAEAEFLAGLKVHPGSPLLSVNLTDLYRQQGREAEAQKVLHQAIETFPDAAAAHHALGLALIRARQYSKAVAEMQSASRLAPDHPRYAYVYVVALQSLGRAEESAAALADALRRMPNDASLLTLALNAALQSGDIKTARSHAQTLGLLRPDDSEIARIKAELH